MHGASDSAVPVPLTSIGGLVTLARPETLPEGASPRNYDWDYLVGSGQTRPGLRNRYSFAGGEISKLPSSAVDVADGGEPWTNPAGVEGNTSYASVAFGSNSVTVIPGDVESTGSGTPWTNPSGATAALAAGTVSSITAFSVASNVVTLTAANNFSAGEFVSFAGMGVATWLNGLTLQVLSTGLSGSQFEVALGWANTTLTSDTGTATPVSTNYASLVNPAAPFSLNPGEGIAWTPATVVSAANSATSNFIGAEAAAAAATWPSGGVMGSASGGPFLGTVDCQWSGFQMPTLPAGAVISRIYPVFYASGFINNSSVFLNISANVTAGQVFLYAIPTGSFGQQYSAPNSSDSLGNTSAIVGQASLTASLKSAGYFPGVPTCQFAASQVALAVYYTVPGGSPIPPNTDQQLSATDLGLNIGGNVTGVEVDFNAGLPAGTGQLSLQLTLAGSPVGAAKIITPGTWPTVEVLGGSSDLWGLSSLIPAQVNGPSGLGVLITPILGSSSEVRVNGLKVKVSYAGQMQSDFLDATEYGFSLTTPVTGLQGALTAYGSGTLTAQLLLNGTPSGELRTFTLPGTSTIIPFGGPTDTWGLGGFTDAELNNAQFGVRLQAFAPTGETTGSANVKNVQLSVWVAPVAANSDWIATFTDQDGTVKNLSVDAAGDLFVEDVTNNPGVFTLIRTGIAPGARVVGSEGAGVEFMAFTDGYQGIDMPLQYTADWIDRITQVGPGQAPTFTPQQASSTDFPIVNITQPAAFVGNGFSYFLQSQGPGNTSPGSVVTIYYADPKAGGVPDADLVTAFNSGNPVYLYVSFAGIPVPFGPQVVLVTGIGEASPPAQPRSFFYFTFTVASTAYTYYPGEGQPTYIPTWQRTLATLTTTVPVPNLTVGSNITVSGNSVSNWNAAWRVTETPNASQMAITGSVVSGGVATLNYAVTGGTANPVAGELVTITNTLNAGGALNVSNAAIASVSGGSTGSFTINVSIGNFSFEAEDGLATTAGTIFDFDPGAGLVGTSTNPIYGTGTGGNLVFNSSGLFIDPGTYQGTVFFITRNGLWTFPAPPVIFTVPDNTTNLQVTGLPIGPPNVVGRGIAITEAGQNGVPGGNFFVLPTAVQFYSQNAKYTATATIVNDNTTSSVLLFFTGAILDQAEAIDQYGFNLFQNVEIGDPGWTVSYGARQWYGLCVNKVQNFINLSFDGGFLSGQTAPLGWTAPDAFGGLVQSPKFGNSYYIANNGLTLGIVGTQMTSGTATYTYVGLDPSSGDPVTVTGTTNGAGIFNVTGATIASVNTGAKTFTVTGLSGTYGFQAETASATVTGTLPRAGLIEQTAFQDANQVAIIKPNTLYSVRVTASNPSGNHNGSLVIALVSAGVVLGSYTLPFSSLTTALAIYEGALLTTALTTVPDGVMLRVYASNLGPGADVLLDRFDVIPTAIPILTTTVFGSYAGLPENVDAVTGTVGFASENQQPVNGAMVLYDTFYGLKAWSGKTPGSSLYSLQKSSDLEPAQWDEPEVAQRSGGAQGPLAFDLGEQWFLGASRNGIYLFVGGQPGKITQEIYQVWDAINWAYGHLIWVKVALNERRIYCGVPMATPNFWLPNAPVNANPTSPNVILMCDFKGLDSGEELKQYPQMHTTMFGTLNAIDMRRKWSIWQIPAPYANICQTAEDAELLICNGRGTSAIYSLDPTALNDAGVTIDSLYTTAGLPELGKRSQVPQLGKNRVRWGYMTATVESEGNIQVTLYANRLPGPGNPPVASWAMPGGWTPGSPSNDDAEAPLNFAATRTFIEFRQNDGLGGFSLANLVPHGEKDSWNAMRGRTGP